MSALCENKGFQVGAVRVPAFTLNRGDWILLRWPGSFGSDSEYALYDALCGVFSCPELTLHSRATVATSFGKRSDQLFRDYHTLGELLAALRPEDRDRFELEIKSRRLSLDTPLNHLPGTARALAGLMLASSLSEGMLVFNTSGLDPTGVRRVYAYVAEKAKQGMGFIELSFPHIGHDEPHPISMVVLEATQ